MHKHVILFAWSNCRSCSALNKSLLTRVRKKIIKQKTKKTLKQYSYSAKKMHIKVGYSATWSVFGGCLGNNFSSEGGFLFYSVAQEHQFIHFSSHFASPGLIITNVLQNVLQLSIVISVTGLLNIKQQWDWKALLCMFFICNTEKQS